MGPLCNKRWLQNSVSRTTNSVTRPSLLPAASKSASGRRSRQSSLKGGSGGDNSGMSRTLLQNFPSSQEERETQADNRPLCTQSFCVHTDIQNGDAEKSERCRSTERLGIFIGSDGRLFAYPDSLSVSQIPQIHVERSSVPVQGTPIRPLDKSFRVYTPYGGHRDFPKEKGNNSTSLSRRLARSEPKSSKTVGTQTIYFVADQITRSDHQLRKIRPSSSPSVHFHRDGVSDPYQYRQSTSEQANEDIGDSQNVFTENLCISQRFPVSLGTTECCSRSCNAGTVTSPAITSISTQSVETSESSVFSSDSYDFGNSVSSQMVASGRSLSSGDSLEDRSSLSHHLYRCQPVRLGSPCGTGGTSVSWTMDRRPIPAPHQCVRDESNFSLSITSSSQGKEHHCTGIHGQHYSGGLYKASGRDSFHRTLRRSVECPEFVLQSQHTAVSEAHTGQVQHSSRPDVQSGQTDLHRVVLESGNSKQSFPDHGLSVNRPVRHTSEPQATILCVTHTGSEGAINRCPIDGLESHTRLRVSTVPSHSSCDKQNKVIPVQDSIDSTFMARQTMVSRAPKSVGVTTGISASNPKPTCSAKRQDFASKPGPSSASRLGIVKQSLPDRQFSSDVAEHISRARRESTVKVYDAKWQIFRHWADQRKIDPIQATPQIVADFLTFLFSVKKCQVSTIKGYRSSISNTLKYKTGYDFGSHPVLSELIKSFAIQRPVDRPLAPKWDLAFVLTHMCKAPFEPLDKASLFYLSVKTVFLVTLATARRVSEVHALSIDSDHLRFSNLDGSLMLRTQVGFLAKNQLPSKAPDSIIIPRLSNYCKSDNFNRMLCPVRAVKIYLKRTKSLRKHRKRLFIPIRGDQDLAKSTLSRWVRYVIKHAYSSISKNPNRLLKPRAHELRALSTSWAYVNYIPLEEILKSAVWSSSSLFASHYLRYFREQTENLRAMGPIIAAQKVVGGRANLAAHEDK